MDSLADLLTEFKIIKFTKNTWMWAVQDYISFLRNRKYNGIVFWGKRWFYWTCNKEVNWGSFWTEFWNRLSGAAFLKRRLCHVFDCHVMKADANELRGVGLPLAEVELILHSGWKLHCPVPTRVLALARWKPGHHLGEFISFKSKATRRKSFHIVQLVGSANITLTEGRGSGVWAVWGSVE